MSHGRGEHIGAGREENVAREHAQRDRPDKPSAGHRLGLVSSAVADLCVPTMVLTVCVSRLRIPYGPDPTPKLLSRFIRRKTDGPA